jgi:hypothetical protein
MTLEEASHQAGVDWRSWQRIEAADVGATLEMIGKLAAALDVDPLTLFQQSAGLHV